MNVFAHSLEHSLGVPESQLWSWQQIEFMALLTSTSAASHSAALNEPTCALAWCDIDIATTNEAAILMGKSF
jgi:hypothetical protein